jgi:hypothetical protein
VNRAAADSEDWRAENSIDSRMPTMNSTPAEHRCGPPRAANAAREWRAALLLATLWGVAIGHAAEPRIGDRLPAASAASKTTPKKSAARTPAAASEFRLIDWDALIPADWDPLKDLKALQGRGMAALKDGDPRAQAALDALRQAWEKAPTSPGLAGQKVRIAGYVVPLDGTSEQMHEFLLVPYFGACIHTPPPPANQIIHVIATPPAKGLRAMEAVWVNGTMKIEASDTAMGNSGYRLDATSISVYRQ